MKQNITVEQLKELNNEQFKKLNKFMSNPYLQKIAYPEFLKATNQDYTEAAHDINIGRMIEILELNYPTLHIDKHLAAPNSLQTKDYYEVFQQGVGSSYGDTLWKGVKNILNIAKCNFNLCKADCEECNGINVVALGEENLYICKDTEKILEQVDDTTLKELGV